MSDIRFNRWLHQSGTGGVYQASSGNIGIGTSVPSTTLDVNGSISATSITATTGTITGNLSVAGVLTYDDVTNIDSVGVITARSDVSIADKIIHTGDTNTAIRFPAADTFTVETAATERLRITPEGSALLTTDGQGGQYSYAMKLGQGVYTNSGTTSPHYGLWVRQLGPRYAQNFGIYSEVEDDAGMYGGAALDGLSSVSGIGVFGGSPISATAYQKAIGVYGKATNVDYNYNSAIGVRGRVETGTTSFINNNGQKSYGGHFVATGKSDVVGVYADAYLAGSPGANQEAIPLLVSSNGSERLRVTSGGDVTIGNSSVAFPSGGGLQVYNASAPRIKLTNSTTGVASGDGLQIYVSGSSAIFDHKENAEMRFYTNATEKLRITKDGKMGLGANNPGDYDGEANDFVVASSDHTGITIASSGSNQRCNLYFSDGTSGTQKYRGAFTYDHNDDSLMVRTAGVERLRIASDGQATFDKGAPASSNQVIARFQAESSRRLDIVWHDSGSLLGFDLPGSHSYIFKCAGSEKLRINSTGVVKFGGQSYATATKSGGVNVSSSCYFDITGSSFVFVKIMIKVGYTGNATYQMHAQYDYVTCNYYTTGSTATRTDILQVEAANAQFNYSDISISRPSNRTVRVTYSPSSGAGTHHPILYVSGVFDSITVS